MTYGVVFIDWDGTLSDSRFWERWRDSPDYNAKFRRLQTALFATEGGKALIVKWMLGRSTYDAVLRYASGITDIPYAELKAELRYSAETMQYRDKDLPDLIKALQSQDTKVVIATDNMDTFRKWTVPALGLDTVFDEILASDELGALKSQFDDDGNSKFFGRFLSTHRIGPHESVLIDNSRNNLVVGQCGIDFLHVSESVSASDHIRKLLQNTR